MKNLKTIALISALFSCGAAFAADDYNPSWYLAPSINSMAPDGQYNAYSSHAGLGLRLGKAVSPHWDVQLGVSSAGNNSQYKQTTLGVDALLLLNRNTVRPFLLVGIGAERDDAGSAKTNPYVALGLGLQASLNDRWTVQADWRRLHSTIDENTFGFKRSNNNYFTLGVNYALDVPAPPPPPVVEAPKPAPAPVVEAPPPPPPPTPRFERVTLSAAELFAFDRSDLASPQPKLDAIATALKNNPSIGNVVVIGYTDRLGSEKYNQALSERRANAVKTYLNNQGVDASRVTAEGRGEADPVVECKQKKRAELIECLAPNRRIEVQPISYDKRVN